MSGLEVLVALAIAVGLVGVVVPVLPGSLLVLGAILVWAWHVGSADRLGRLRGRGRFVAARRRREVRRPGPPAQGGRHPRPRRCSLGGVLGVVGFFVIPVVGLVIGFVLGVYLAELHRVGAERGLARHRARAEGGRPLHADRAGRRPARRGRLGRRRGRRPDSMVRPPRRSAQRRLRALGLHRRRRLTAYVGLAGRPTACLGAALGTVVLAVFVRGDPTGADFAWGLLAGRRQRHRHGVPLPRVRSGRMGVVAPVSAVGAALLPAASASLTGERPTLLVWVGMLRGLPGIWLVSREPAPPGRARAGAAGLLDGILAGVGFGLLFAALGQVPTEAGFWPVAANQVGLAASPSPWPRCCLGGDPVPRGAATGGAGRGSAGHPRPSSASCSPAAGSAQRRGRAHLALPRVHRAARHPGAARAAAPRPGRWGWRCARQPWSAWRWADQPPSAVTATPVEVTSTRWRSGTSTQRGSSS